jgi:hypothetical protein
MCGVRCAVCGVRCAVCGVWFRASFQVTKTHLEEVVVVVGVDSVLGHSLQSVGEV